MAKKKKKNITKLQKKRRKFLTEKIIMTICKWVLLLAPITAYVIYRRNVYFTTKDGLSVSFGAILALVVTILVVKGQAKLFKGIWKYVIAFILCVLLQVVLIDAMFISACILIGYFLSMWFNAPIDRRTKLIEKIDEAQINVDAMADVELNVKEVKMVENE